MHLIPSAPPLLEVFNDEVADYNCELGCDVEFLVGEGSVMRIPVHSCKLMQFPVFRAMLTHYGLTGTKSVFGDAEESNKGCAGELMKQIPVEDVDGKAFDNLMRFIYGETVNFQLQTVEVVVETLKAAHKYLITPVVRACAKHLSKMISLGNVIWIYASVGYLCNDVDNLEELTKKESQKQVPKSVPPVTRATSNENDKNFSDDFSAGLEIKRLCVWLLSQVLTFIDVHARHVLLMDEVEQLDNSSLQFLLKRDSLDVSESVVFFATLRWAETQCKRLQLPLTTESKRLVLHDLLYLARFFQMTDNEFRAGPEVSGLLTPAEGEVIKNMIIHGRPHACFQNGNYQIASELYSLCKHWTYLNRPRTPSLLKSGVKRKSNGDNETSAMAKSKKSFKEPKRSNSLKLKMMGGRIKDFCLRRNTDSNVNYQQYPNEMCSGRKKSNEKGLIEKSKPPTGNTPVQGKTKKSGNGDSTWSKAIFVTVNVFAFFFD